MTSHERSIIAITGEERVQFLQGIITQDVNTLLPNTLKFAALLSPQGKLLHDFFVFAQDDAILLDVAAAHKETFLKRLAMYKLRAKITLHDVSQEWHLHYSDTQGFTDPRHSELPRRAYSHFTHHAPHITHHDYHTRRLALGIPETPFDTSEEDVAMDLSYDLLNAISFTKGCYVGQEVTARMHYKNIARKGFYRVAARQTLPAFGAEIRSETEKLGSLRGSIGNHGLALLKFEPTEQARAAGASIIVDNQPITLTLPEWMQSKLTQFQTMHENQ